MAVEQDTQIWEEIRSRTEEETRKEPMLASFLYATVLNHDSLEAALSFHLSHKLESPTLTASTLRDLIDYAYSTDPKVSEAIREDIAAVCDRDPACGGFAEILLYYKGYHALQAYRAANFYWKQGRRSLARYLQSRISETFAVDIHPAATIGHGILIDHATSVVIGETAVVENYVSILHEVTLGGTGKTSGQRHPTVREGVLIAAGAKVLGAVEVGKNAKIASGAVVLDDVPPHTTVAGVPAKVVGTPTAESPALEMSQKIEESLTSAQL